MRQCSAHNAHVQWHADFSRRVGIFTRSRYRQTGGRCYGSCGILRIFSNDVTSPPMGVFLKVVLHSIEFWMAWVDAEAQDFGDAGRSTHGEM